jgi:hypothetical protein
MEVTYNEEATSYTVCGGICTCVLRLAIFAYTMWRLQLLISRGRNTIIETVMFRDLENEEPYKLKDSDFHIYA